MTRQPHFVVIVGAGYRREDRGSVALDLPLLHLQRGVTSSSAKAAPSLAPASLQKLHRSEVLCVCQAAGGVAVELRSAVLRIVRRSSGPAGLVATATGSSAVSTAFAVRDSGTTRLPLLAADSPFMSPIPSSPVLDPASGALVAQLAPGQHIADAYEYAAARYDSAPSDPAYTISTVTEAGHWGPNPFATINPVHIPDRAAPAPGDDGWMILVDRSRGLVITMWRARKVGGAWQCDWAGIYPLNGVGNDSDVLGGFGNGAGLDFEAGAITQQDVLAGVIRHALLFSSDMGDPSRFRYPATKTDAGNWPNSANPKLPEGSRVQLDPSIDVDAIPGITPMEKLVARALQTYGAYDSDHGGARMAFLFEGQDLTDPNRQPPTRPGDPTRPGGVYANAGLQWDYFDFVHVPWNRLRVLSSWNGR